MLSTDLKRISKANLLRRYFISDTFYRIIGDETRSLTAQSLLTSFSSTSCEFVERFEEEFRRVSIEVSLKFLPRTKASVSLL